MKDKKADHRKIGKELDLFSFHDVAPGAIFWHAKGWMIYRALIDFIRESIASEGYEEISTPVMVKNKLFKQSGHWDHFGEHNMFNLAIYDDEEIRAAKGKPLEVNYTLKPMNCPEAALVYGTKTRSYNDLPVKYSEYGVLHRRELSGVLGGAFRVRQFAIDDAHLFVRPDQVENEMHKLIESVMGFYKSFGFKPNFYLSTRPDKAMGDKKTWKKAENGLESALKKAEVKFEIKPKDGAFYGPKIDIHINDSQDRDWQLATIQLDFQMPSKERMNLSYVDKDGQKKTPVMIHRGIFGSFERFIGILIEHFAGAFPIWLSPVQVKVIPVSEKSVKYAIKVAKTLGEENVRVELDERNETMSAKIRDAQMEKVPYMLVVGEKEEKAEKVAVRLRDGTDLGLTSTPDFIKRVQKQIDSKSLDL